MHKSFMKMIGAAVFITLLMPFGMMFANESASASSLTSKTANWYDVEEASNLLSRVKTRAINTSNALGQNQIAETDLAWQIQTLNLEKARSNVNKMDADLHQLDKISSGAEPWQQRLIRKVTPQAREMTYQLDAAINTMNQYQSKDHLALTQYPQNIAQVCKNANQVANTIGTVTQNAHAEQKTAALHKLNIANTGS
jgi:hypothetical protein